MFFNSVGGNYLKAQAQNSYEKARCELRRKEITRRSIQSLAAINKSIQDMKDFLKDIKASSGCYKDEASETDIMQGTEKTKRATRGSAKITDSSNNFNLDRRKRELDAQSFPLLDEISERNTLRKSASVKTSKGLGNEEGERDKERSKGRGASQAHEWLLRDGTDGRLPGRARKRTSKSGSESSVTGISPGKKLQHAEKSSCNTQDTQSLCRTHKVAPQISGPKLAWGEKALEGGERLATTQPGVNTAVIRRSQTSQEKVSKPKQQDGGDRLIPSKPGTDLTVIPRRQTASKNVSHPKLQDRSKLAWGEKPQDGGDYLISSQPGAGAKGIRQTTPEKASQPKLQEGGNRLTSPKPGANATVIRHSQTAPEKASRPKRQGDGDLLIRSESSTDVTVIRRSQTAPEKASRPKLHVRSAALSERDLDFKEANYLSTSELKKLKIHVSMSKTERRRILQELIANCTVPTDRSVLERERQRLLRGKVRQYFKMLFEQTEVKESIEDDVFSDD